MDEINYHEPVSLLLAGEAPRETTLAEAVHLVVHEEDALVRASAHILRDGAPIRQLRDIEAIYARPDFPRAA
jgi:hypothetical protein